MNRPRQSHTRTCLGLLAVTLGLGLARERAGAHGLPPAAVAIVAQDEQGPRIVRLTAGLALRQADGAYRYVCPALWGDADSLPAYALPDQPAVVLSSTGLWLLQSDGNATRHPDALAEGYALDLAAQGGKLFVLRSVERTGSEIIQVSATQVTRIWRDAQLWTSLTAGADFLAVARLTEGDRLAQRKLTPDGRGLSDAEAAAPAGTVNVLARAAGSKLYLVLAYNGGRQLGKLDDGGWNPLHSANAAIAGPVQLEGAGTYVALDGSLSQLEGGALVPFEAARDAAVSCLDCYERHCYACTREGVQALTPAGLAAPTFDLSKLVSPAVAGVSDEIAAQCELQWQHLRFDLLAFGVSLREDGPGAGPAPAAVGGEPVGASGGTPAGGDAPKPAADGRGCSCGLLGRTNGSGALALGELLLVGGLRLRRPRR
jgi:hypothetical protein